jgi:hypothetical protein
MAPTEGARPPPDETAGSPLTYLIV